jgi:hypothetical protein
MPFDSFDPSFDAFVASDAFDDVRVNDVTA